MDGLGVPLIDVLILQFQALLCLGVRMSTVHFSSLGLGFRVLASFSTVAIRSKRDY